MYKVTFQLRTPVCFIDRPLFDAMIAYAYAREYLGNKFKQGLNYDESELIDFEAMPITKHPDGYFLASWMFWDSEKEIEFTGSWKKRWANEYDHLADFGKQKRKVRINAGPYKSYDMPINLHTIPEVWFYFESDNVSEVARLLEKWIYGIGKKRSQGYGEIRDYQIEEEDNMEWHDGVLRPVPITEEQFNQLMKSDNVKVGVTYTGYRPPYWLPSNQGYCVC